MINWFIFLPVLAFGICGFTAWQIAGRKKKEPVVVKTSRVRKVLKEPLENPTKVSLEKFRKKHGKDKIQTVLTLDDGRKFVCWAHWEKNGDEFEWMARIGDDPLAVIWEHRKNRALKLPEQEQKP